jgi:acyl-CoA thioesterase-1
MTSSRTLRIVGVVGAFVVASAMAGAVAHAATTKTAKATSSAAAVALSTPAAAPTPYRTAPLTAVAIGDSIMDGHGLTEAQSWPSVLADSEGWNLTDLASDGTGYVTVGAANDTFAAQADKAVALDPDIVIVAGSSNDLGQDTTAVQQAEARLVQTISTKLPRARIVAVNTFWGDTTPPAQLADFDSVVEQSVAGSSGTYLDVGQPLAGRADLMQSDDVHPTAAGQKLLASEISDRLPDDLKAAPLAN